MTSSARRAAGDLRVRPATTADVEAILDLLEAVAAEGRWVAQEAPIDRVVNRARFTAAVEDPGRLLLVAGAGGALAGHLGLWGEAPGVMAIGMCVAEEWRGRGVGRALLGAAVDAARTRGVHKLRLEVWPHNRAALGLYRSAGFVEEGRLRRHYRRRDGSLWDAVVMGLVLDEASPGSPHPDAVPS